jgi:hypothetical protein
MDDMVNFDLAVIAFYGPILMPAQKHEFWIPTGRESLSILHGCSFQLLNFFIEFYRGG